MYTSTKLCIEKKRSNFKMLFLLTQLVAYWLVCVVQATVITSPLTAVGRKYVCPQEQLTYVCNGTGNTIDVYAPPDVPSGAPVFFARGNDIDGTAIRLNSLFVTLVSSEEPFMVTNVQVTNPRVVNRIVCDVQSEVAEVMLNISGPPLDVNSQNIYLESSRGKNRLVTANWTSTAGDYDLSHYRVQLLLQNGTEIDSKAISSASEVQEATFIVLIESDVEVFAKITTFSVCDGESDGVSTVVLPILNGGTNWTYSVTVIFLTISIAMFDQNYI